MCKVAFVEQSLFGLPPTTLDEQAALRAIVCPILPLARLAYCAKSWCEAKHLDPSGSGRLSHHVKANGTACSYRSRLRIRGLLPSVLTDPFVCLHFVRPRRAMP